MRTGYWTWRADSRGQVFCSLLVSRQEWQSDTLLTWRHKNALLSAREERRRRLRQGPLPPLLLRQKPLMKMIKHIMKVKAQLSLNHDSDNGRDPLKYDCSSYREQK